MGDSPAATNDAGASGPSAARAAAVALAEIDALAGELERIAQACADHPARAPLALMPWLDRVLAALGWQLRVLERAAARRRAEVSVPVAWRDVAPDEDGGLGAKVEALRPDLVTQGVAGLVAGWLLEVDLRDDHHQIVDPLVEARGARVLLSRKLGEVMAALEPVRAAYDALAAVAEAGGEPAGVARRADGLLDFAARQIRLRLAGQIASAGYVVRRHVEALRSARGS